MQVIKKNIIKKYKVMLNSRVQWTGT